LTKNILKELTSQTIFTENTLKFLLYTLFTTTKLVNISY